MRLWPTTYYARLGIHIKALLTDNGTSYRSFAFADACKELRPQTPPHPPLHATHQRQTGVPTDRSWFVGWKAERFIQTALREWAYAQTFQNSEEREQQLAPWIHQYNFHRPHSSLARSPPISRSGLDVNNLLRLHS